MAYISNFSFDNLSRIGDDNCALSQRNIQNVEAANYLLTNYFVQDCGMKKPIEIATNQPNVFYNGSHQVGLGGCNVDANSNLLIGTIQTRSKCPISLYERPFKTVPYLGRGPSNPVLESQIQQGDLARTQRSVNNITESSFLNNHYTPLVASLKETITNPINLVEGIAHENWVRGGVPSRDLTKDGDNYMSSMKMREFQES